MNINCTAMPSFQNLYKYQFYSYLAFKEQISSVVSVTNNSNLNDHSKIASVTIPMYFETKNVLKQILFSGVKYLQVASFIFCSLCSSSVEKCYTNYI